VVVRKWGVGVFYEKFNHKDFRLRSYDMAELGNEIKKIIEAAEKGDVKAQYELGEVYRVGGGVPKDPEKARDWLTKAVKLSTTEVNMGGINIEALRSLVEMYALEEVTPKAGEDQRYWFDQLTRFADSGSPRALHLLGECYEYGRWGVVMEDERKAESLYNNAFYRYAKVAAKLCGHEFYGYSAEFANNSDPGSLYWLAELRYHMAGMAGVKLQDDEYNYLKQCVIKSAELGFPPALYKIGGYIFNGSFAYNTDFKRNVQEGVRWYVRAAEQGDKYAQQRLGDCYTKGEGVPKDKEKANYWYTKSAERGWKPAQYDLGVNYANGDGVPKDLEMAKYWISLAADGNECKKEKEALAKIPKGAKLLKNAGGGCYIATCVYGSYDAPEVLCLRQFRDEVLASSIFGRLFIALYYFFSPPIAERLKKMQRTNVFVRKTLDKAVERLNKKFHNQNDKM